VARVNKTKHPVNKKAVLSKARPGHGGKAREDCIAGLHVGKKNQHI